MNYSNYKLHRASHGRGVHGGRNNQIPTERWAGTTPWLMYDLWKCMLFTSRLVHRHGARQAVRAHSAPSLRPSIMMLDAVVLASSCTWPRATVSSRTRASRSSASSPPTPARRSCCPRLRPGSPPCSTITSTPSSARAAPAPRSPRTAMRWKACSGY
jgi:hypothetical protein